MCVEPALLGLRWTEGCGDSFGGVDAGKDDKEPRRSALVAAMRSGSELAMMMMTMNGSMRVRGSFARALWPDSHDGIVLECVGLDRISCGVMRCAAMRCELGRQGGAQSIHCQCAPASRGVNSEAD